MTQFTVVGGRGFIGSRLVAQLAALGHAVQVPRRGEWLSSPGHLVYAAGLTADFREKPHETVRAHVCDLLGAIEHGGFDSFLYLSSTRVYAGASSSGEDVPLTVNPIDPDHLYNLSKLMGESVCHSSGNPRVRVVRLSNVYGPELGSTTFLDSIIRDAVIGGHVVLTGHPDSAKDYVHVDDVVSVLPRISLTGHHRVYNLASGVNVSNQAILDRLCAITGCRVETAGTGPPLAYPPIDITRIRNEFGADPRPLLPELASFVDTCKQRLRAAA